jgi:uncharacterized membrane protein (UPF0127 family)
MKGLMILVIVALVAMFVFSRFIFCSTEGFQNGVFLRKNGSYPVSLEIAQTPQDIQQGLMFRTHLPADTGMLFQFPTEEHRSFWMRNTLIPLDMIFIRSTGRIAHIEHAVPPQTETLRHSKEPVQYVVELPGGTARSKGIQVGDRFQYE